MENENEVNQDINGDDVNTSGDSKPQYSETEKQLYTRLKKEEARVKELEAKLGDKAPTFSQQTNTTDDERFERLELRQEGYTNEQISFILKNGGRQALEDPYVKMAIERDREEKRATESVAMNVSSKSAIERKYSQAELANMSSDEMEAVLTGRKR